MSLQYARVHMNDEHPRFSTGGASGNPPLYIQPMQQAGLQYGQAHLQRTPTAVIMQQPQTTNMEMGTRPRDFMTWSIFGCLCCILPVGLCAIAASHNSRSKADSGDIEGAKASSWMALGINIANTILGAIVITFMIVLYSKNSTTTTNDYI